MNPRRRNVEIGKLPPEDIVEWLLVKTTEARVSFQYDLAIELSRHAYGVALQYQDLGHYYSEAMARAEGENRAAWGAKNAPPKPR